MTGFKWIEIYLSGSNLTSMNIDLLLIEYAQTCVYGYSYFTCKVNQKKIYIYIYIFHVQLMNGEVLYFHYNPNPNRGKGEKLS